MNGLQATMQKIRNDQTLTEQFLEAVEEGQDETVAFFRSIGCNVSAEDLIEGLSDLVQDREMTQEELEFVTGGCKAGTTSFFIGASSALL